MQTAIQTRINFEPRRQSYTAGLTIEDAFIQGNPRIEIISNGGVPTTIPGHWGPVLADSDVMVLVPDMHMFLYTSNLDNFKFGAEPMLDFLVHAEASRERLRKSGDRLSMVQLGDMYELCFPHPSFGRDVTVRDIRASHPIYDEIIKLFHELEFKFVVGNHDAEYRQKRGGMYAASDGSVYFEHGYTADRWFHFTNPDHRHWRWSMKVLRGLRRVENRIHQVRRKLSDWDEQCHRAFGVDSGDQERTGITAPAEYPRRHFRYFESVVESFARRPCVCVIAHTHRPYLSLDFADGECIYVDAGAWSEGRSDFVVITNREIAVCRYKRTAWPMPRPSLSSAS
jgi:hypothetical protein